MPEHLFSRIQSGHSDHSVSPVSKENGPAIMEQLFRGKPAAGVLYQGIILAVRFNF